MEPSIALDGLGRKRSKRDSKKSATSSKYDAVLLDIEGTTTPISFVKDVLFPFAKENVRSYLKRNWESKQCKEDVKVLRKQAIKDKEMEGAVSIPKERKGGVQEEIGHVSQSQVIEAVVNNVLWQMSTGRKTTSLKQLQGHIWKEAYENGKIKGELYDDVAPALRQWTSANIKIYIYSSGSVEAQKLLFGNSQNGNLLKYLSGHFDTKVGAKVDSGSYKKIAKAVGLKPASILFVTDVVNEARAASEAGFGTAISVRPGNSQLLDLDRKNFWTISSFDELLTDRKVRSKKFKTGLLE